LTKEEAKGEWAQRRGEMLRTIVTSNVWVVQRIAVLAVVLARPLLLRMGLLDGLLLASAIHLCNRRGGGVQWMWMVMKPSNRRSGGGYSALTAEAARSIVVVAAL
jgi:hypothetical protein